MNNQHYKIIVECGPILQVTIYRKNDVCSYEPKLHSRKRLEKYLNSNKDNYDVWHIFGRFVIYVTYDLKDK